MNINADLTKPALVHSESLPWVPSPLPGVERRMLERDGDEVARATSLVRYAPNSTFKPHTHAKGEEFLVLSGVFSDESGDFPEGMYVRNPPGSKHTPVCRDGCLILVKLRQMTPEDEAYVRIDTTDRSLWTGPSGGEAILPLFESDSEEVCMLRWAGNSQIEFPYSRGVEYFVLEGKFKDAQMTCRKGSWLRLPGHGHHSIRVLEDTMVYRKTRHL